jgi:ribosomal protein S18 acetylase RimI-like enzyme
MEKSMKSIHFRPILAEDLSLAWNNRRDGFRISFGQNEPLSRGLATLREYEEFIGTLQKNDISAAVFALNGAEIIGQVELRLDANREGWVYFYYISLKWRGRGLAHYLDEYAIRSFKNKGITKAGLRVALTNQPARQFYEKQGWVADGIEPKDDRLMVYRRIFY